MHHYRKTIQNYTAFNNQDAISSGCTFCKEVGGKRIQRETETMFVIPNRVHYDIFEGRKVIDHLMVIPKRHVESLANFTDQEKIDHMTIMGEYENQGYNIYARSTTSISRSVAHQHTHLIKLSDTRKPRLLFYSQKPYVLIQK